MKKIDRRGFMGALAGALILPLLPEKPYEPVGYMDPHSPGSMDIDHVTLDGKRIERVFELDDVEGWAKWYGPNMEVDGDTIRSYHGTGEVRVHWKA